jgi:hypothetical protein
METTKKRGRPKKIDKQVDVALEKLEDKPISLILKLNGQVVEIKTDNVLYTLRELPARPDFLKSMVYIEVKYQGRTFFRVFKVPMFRMLLQNSGRQLMLAKVINQTLGITGENLYA